MGRPQGGHRVVRSIRCGGRACQPREAGGGHIGGELGGGHGGGEGRQQVRLEAGRHAGKTWSRGQKLYIYVIGIPERRGECKLVSDIYHGDLIITCLCVPPVPQVWPISDFFAPRVQMSLGRRWRGRRDGGDRSDPDELGQPGDGRTVEG